MNDKLLDIYRIEYDKLKAEQLQRITFRDVQIPFSIFLGIAPILSVAFAKDNVFGFNLLLVVPVICITLGWSYVANDEKISTIGDYVREELKSRVSDAMKQENSDGSASNIELSEELSSLIFGWEGFHKGDKFKSERKVTQFIVNLLTFVLPGIIALLIFLALKGDSQTSDKASFYQDILEGWYTIGTPMKSTISLEVFLIFILGCWIYVYSGFVKNLRAIFSKWTRSLFGS